MFAYIFGVKNRLFSFVSSANIFTVQPIKFSKTFIGPNFAELDGKLFVALTFLIAAGRLIGGARYFIIYYALQKHWKMNIFCKIINFFRIFLKPNRKCMSALRRHTLQGTPFQDIFCIAWDPDKWNLEEILGRRHQREIRSARDLGSNSSHIVRFVCLYHHSWDWCSIESRPCSK